jgi:hypothetical protein
MKKAMNPSRDREVAEMTETLRTVINSSPLTFSSTAIRRFTLFVANPSAENLAELVTASAQYRTEVNRIR